MVAGLERRDAGVQPTAGEAEIAQEVQQLVPAALVGEMQLKVVQVALVGDRQVGHAQKGGDGRELLRAHGMLHDDDGVVHIPSPDKVVPEQVLDLVEKTEGAADADLAGIVYGLVPMGRLDAEDAGTEVHRDIRGRGVGRFDPDPGAGLAVPDFQALGNVDINAGSALVHQAVAQERLHIGPRAAVQDGDFAVVQLDEGIVHAEAGKGRHDVLDGDRLSAIPGNGGAAGGIGDILGNGVDDRGSGKVRPAEPDSVVNGRRHQFHMRIGAGMESLAFEKISIPEGMLVTMHQRLSS